MNENHETLPEILEDLRALASEVPGEAPPHVEARLMAEFRRRKRRRNLRIWAPTIGLAAAAAMALLFWGKPGVAQKPAAAVIQTVVPAADDDSEAGFYPLPEAEGLPAVENAMVVRVQLPVSSLQLMGVPIDGVPEERADSSVQADLLLGQDGLARAVRLAP
jgi:hypothetical protein